jgi:hypothetical protein
MVDAPHTESGQPHNPSVRHEPTDANFRWIMCIGVASLVLAVLIHWGLLEALFGYCAYQARIKESTFPLAEGQKQELPRQPLLEPLERLAPRGEVRAPARQPPEENQLDRYGPTPEEGYVRIPINRAMRLVEDQLPVEKQKTQKRGSQGEKR